MVFPAALLGVVTSLVTRVAQQSITAASFGPSSPFIHPFWSTQPLGAHITPPTSTLASENNSALMCGVAPLGRCMFADDDEWVGRVLPMWRAVQDSSSSSSSASKHLTLPFTRNLSAVRMLGGLTHNWPHSTAKKQVYQELPQWDLCYRDASTGALVHNWTRMDTTLDSFVAAGITPSPIVLDNIPYAFVKAENRFFGGFGHGAAPDNTTEFGEFIEAMVRHLVARYGHFEVSSWRFRLGTEAQGNRLGPPWVGVDGNGVAALPTADGSLKNFSHGLDQYVATYIAASSAVKRVVPEAKFGPCNLAGIGAPQGPHDDSVYSMDGGSAGSPVVNNLMASRLYAAGAPVDFIAMSEYSRSGPGKAKGDRQASPQAMQSGVERITEIGILATTGKITGSDITIPVEVHEYGWAAWIGYRGGPRWPHGSFGAAYNVASWLYMRRGGAKRIFTWGYKFDDSLAVVNPEASGATAAHAGRPLLSGWGWTLGAMELLLGTDGDTISAEMVVDTPGPLAPFYNYTFGVFRMAQPKARTLHYLITAFSGNFTDHSVVDVTLRITAADFPRTTSTDSTATQPVSFWDLSNRSAVTVTERAFNSTTCAHDTIRADLDAAGGFDAGLVNEELPSVDAVHEMCTAKGLDLAAKSTKKYLQMSDASLLPRPFSGKVVVDGSALVITMRGVERSSLVLLSFTAAAV